MIADEVELRCSLEWIAKMYASQDRQAVEPAWHPEMRQEMAAETEFMRLKIEREIAEYLAAKYGYVRKSAEHPVSSVMRSEHLVEQMAEQAA